MPDRFFGPGPPLAGRLFLTGSEAHHLAHVRRLVPGDRVEVFDGRGSAHRAEVVRMDTDRVELRALEPVPDRAAPVELVLATAVPKGERFDWLVEKATELGVARLVPLRTRRSTVDPRPAKLERLRRTIIESCKQCGRSRLMDLEAPTHWEAYVDAERAAVRLLAHPGGAGFGAWPVGGPVSVAIGPEGGFEESEVAAAQAAGWIPVSLGPTLLRIETAGLVAAARVLARAETGSIR